MYVRKRKLDTGMKMLRFTQHADIEGVSHLMQLPNVVAYRQRQPNDPAASQRYERKEAEEDPHQQARKGGARFVASPHPS